MFSLHASSGRKFKLSALTIRNILHIDSGYTLLRILSIPRRESVCRQEMNMHDRISFGM